MKALSTVHRALIQVFFTFYLYPSGLSYYFTHDHRADRVLSIFLPQIS